VFGKTPDFVGYMSLSHCLIKIIDFIATKIAIALTQIETIAAILFARLY